jgi:hypothetical protein
MPSPGLADGEGVGLGESISIVGGLKGVLGVSSLIGAGEGCKDGHRIG